jgi:RNA polymerase sigma-70 factor (ECF subfamily)
LQDLADAVARVRAGDRAAFRQIVESTQQRLVRLGARMLGNLAEAEDVVQEAYVKAFNAITSGQFDQRSKVETWLYSIVVHTAIDSSRKRQRRREDDSIEGDAQYQPFAQLEARQSLMELQRWLAVLPEEQRTVLLLCSFEGLSGKEVAEILQCSEGAVEQRLVRARQALRQQMNQRNPS